MLAAALMLTLFVACAERADVVAANSATPTNTAVVAEIDQSADNTKTVSNNSVASTDDLDELLAAASWQAVDEAKRKGSAALPVVRRFSNDKNFVIRQITMACVEAIGDPSGADILAGGLSDSNVNVRLAAARALSMGAYPTAANAITKAIEGASEETFRELLVKAAGFSPESKTISVLKPFASGDSVLARNTVFALAKLKDPTGQKTLSAMLSSTLPRTRYESLEGLCYVNDKKFSGQAKRLLSDNAVGLRIGSTRNPKQRRVADQAVDSLVCLHQLRPAFLTAAERIYTPAEIGTIRNMVK